MTSDERSPLLPSAAQTAPEDSTRSLGSQAATGSVIVKEIGLIFKDSLPTSLGYMLQNSVQTVSVAVVSLNGSDTDLSAAAHGFMIAMVTAWTLALGGTTAMDTLASVAYSRSLAPGLSKTASRQVREQVGLLLQRGLVISALLFAPVALLWVFSRPVLLVLDQPPVVAEKVQTFLRTLVVGGPGYILFESLKKYVQVQGDSRAPTIVLAATFPLNLGLNLLFIRHLNFGLLGSPIAVSIIYYLAAVLLLLHIYFFGRDTTSLGWGGWNLKKALEPHATWVYARLAISGWVMVASEWVAFEVVALVAGSLGEIPLAAQSVIMTADQLINTLPFGLGVASSSRIAHLLGTAVASITAAYGGPSKASVSHLPLAAQSAFLLSTIQGLCIGLPLFFSRNHFGKLFSDSPSVIHEVASVIPLVALFQISDGWAQSQGGVLRGMGRQEVGASANLVAYYLIALPLGIWLAKGSPALGLEGLWIGQCLALSLVGVLEYIAVCLTNWQKQVEMARLRGDDSGDGTDSQLSV